MELELTPDQEFFAATTRRFLDEHAPTADIRAMRHDPVGFAGGLLEAGRRAGLDLAARRGGRRWRHHLRPRRSPTSRSSPHEFGRHAAPGPLVPTNLVAGDALALGKRRAEGSGARRAAERRAHRGVVSTGHRSARTASPTSRSKRCRAAEGSVSRA